jgi:acetolactate synthase-1/2/3 large subunit
LILPADVSWGSGGAPAAPAPGPARRSAADGAVDAVAKVLTTGEPAAILLGGSALRRPHLRAAARIAAGTSARLLAATFVPLTERGVGLPAVEKLPYFAEGAVAALAGLRHLVLVDAAAPVSFFAYPGQPSDLVPVGCQVHVLAGADVDAAEALGRLADLVGRDAPAPPSHPPSPPAAGALTAASAAAVIGARMPEHAIVSDESATASFFLGAATAASPPHDWLQLTGGAIGQGLPVATGAAVACPDRPVLALEADGSAMYTIQALWTHAREGLDVTTIIFNNRSYAILNIELQRTGAGEAGPKARDLLDLSRPDLDFVRLAEGMGVPAVAAHTAEELTAAIERAVAEPGPHLIDAVLSR